MKTFTQLEAALFDDLALQAYAVLDGASIPGLADALDGHHPKYECLFRGDLDAGMAEAAPYLVALDPGGSFAPWLLQNGWGEHYGIFVLSKESLPALRLHLRRSLRVYRESGEAVLFRYYDPRVFRAFAPSMLPAEAKAFFGPVESFLCESEDAKEFLRFRQSPEGVKTDAENVD